jgi:hypothetical protein
MKLIILPLFFFFLTFANFADQESPNLLTPAGMQQDLQLLKTAWEQFHPGLYRFNTKQEIDRLFERAVVDASRPLSRKAFYMLLSQLTEKLRCGHTYPNFWNQTDEVQAEVFSKSVLPVLFRVIDNRIIVTHNLSSAYIVPGDEISSINGVNCEKLLQTLITVSRSDGQNSSHKKTDNFCIYPIDADSAGYAFFDIYAPLFYEQLFNVKVFTCTLKNCKGEKRTVVFSAMTKAERHIAYIKRFGTLPTGEANWSLKQLTPETALLHIGDFETWNWKNDYHVFLDSILSVINSNGTTGLIIDIRGNEGGADAARDYLFTCVAEKPFVKIRSLRLQTFLSVPDSLRPLFKTWNRELFLPQDTTDYDKYGERFYYEKQRSLPETLFPRPNSFVGKCCLLTNATNSSAGFTLANMFQQSGRGLIIGEPTGGSKQGINGGQFFLLYLPYSGIEIDLPLIWQKPVSAAADNGVVPDHIVCTSRKAICAGRDEQLDAALDILSRTTK